MTTSTETKGPILVTGGAGYIGTHTILCLLKDGYNVVVVDNLVNSTVTSLDRVAELACLDTNSRKERLVFHNVDLCDRDALKQVFETSPTFSACIHFAGLKAVGESTKIPLKYYHNNLTGTFFLLELMNEYRCRSIVFSSSATVYGSADKMPITEETKVGNGITNAYGRTKYMIEEILRDFYKSTALGDRVTDWCVVILRYFNPIGAHLSGKIGEDPHGIPNNLMPYVAQVAAGRREFLTVFGNDYPTPDGTGVRDYLHVMDLADGHLSAIKYIKKKEKGIFTFNLGTGNGFSVLDMVKAMSKACGHEIEYKLGRRRPGDIATCYADASLAKKEMGWEAKLSLDEMCRDLWSWQSKNPNGYAS
jgi:UDP-glucose 4-epimerase